MAVGVSNYSVEDPLTGNRLCRRFIGRIACLPAGCGAGAQAVATGVSPVVCKRDACTYHAQDLVFRVFPIDVVNPKQGTLKTF